MTEELRNCPDCGDPIVGSAWNGGRCWDCHDASCAWGLHDSPLAPVGFDPTIAGERWDDDY
jgi:hypothetical protein